MRVAIIGTARRSDYLYGPLVQALPEEVELVGVWGRSAESAGRLGKSLGVPAFTDIDKLKRDCAPEIGIVSVAYDANGQIGLMAVEAGLNVLLETPIAHKLGEADAIIGAATKRKVKVEVAEQFHRRPLEAIKLKLIEVGVFGRVHTSFNDFAGHGYHGVSVMRSYLGFDAKPTIVTGKVLTQPIQPHRQRLGRRNTMSSETFEHGLISFEDNRLGVYHWSNIAYDSPIRWWRSGRFLGEKGMGITMGIGPFAEDRLTLLAPGDEGHREIVIERRWERVDGGALVAMVAHTGDKDRPLIRWDNPFRPAAQGHGRQWHDDEIGVAGCLMSLVNAVRKNRKPSYGALQGRLDQELTLAIRLSSAKGGAPVTLPLDVAEVDGSTPAPPAPYFGKGKDKRKA